MIKFLVNKAAAIFTVAFLILNVGVFSYIRLPRESLFVHSTRCHAMSPLPPLTLQLTENSHRNQCANIESAQSRIDACRGPARVR